MDPNQGKLNPVHGLKFLPELDSLRAFAVSIVICSHWLGFNSLLGLFFSGDLGVIIFFTLSGFLITRILLNERIKNELGLVSEKKSLLNFYAKRVLRIFPAYYLLLIFLYISNKNIYDGSFKWHFFYASNFYFSLIHKNWLAGISHFWSLAVEEQFYMFWPILIIFTPKKMTKIIIIITLVIGPIFRLTNLNGNELYKFLTPSCFDALGIGALFAYYENEVMKFTRSRTTLLSLLLLCSFLSLAACNLSIKSQNLKDVILNFNMAIFSVLLIIKILTTKNLLLKKIFNWKILTFIGTISYGLYLYHNVIPFYYVENIPFIFSYILRALLLLVATIASYHIIEKPLLNLKQKFQ